MGARTISEGEARDRLPELADRAIVGEEARTTRGGAVAAKLFDGRTAERSVPRGETTPSTLGLAVVD